MSEAISDEVASQGFDARELSADDLKRLGFKRVSRGDAIRAMCVQCVGTVHEVRKCECSACPIWIFRFGSDPWREQREMTEEQRAAGAERLRKARESRNVSDPPPVRKISLFDDD